MYKLARRQAGLGGWKARYWQTTFRSTVSIFTSKLQFSAYTITKLSPNAATVMYLKLRILLLYA